ncbi:MAG: hypothetical protein Q4A95_00495 [Enterococcus hirae]|nr:hypothetical protein [Enterococcus hirae]
MIDAELVGLLEGRVKQKSEKAIYSTIIQSQSSSSEKQEDQSQPLNNKGESLKKNKLDMDENTGWAPQKDTLKKHNLIPKLTAITNLF